MSPSYLEGTAHLGGINIGTKINDQLDNSTFPDLSVKINRHAVRIHPGEHWGGSISTIGVLNKTLFVPLRKLFGVTLACHFILGYGNGLVIGHVKRCDLILWDTEADRAVVELTRGLEGVDIAFQGGGDDETSFGHE